MDGDAPASLRHASKGVLSLVGPSKDSKQYKGPAVGSQFFITLSEGPHTSLDGAHTPIGELVEGAEVLDRLDEAFTDDRGRPLVDVRVTHTHVLDDPLGDPPSLPSPPASPPPGRPGEERVPERLAASASSASASSAGGAAADTLEQLADAEARSRAVVLEMVGDLPDADAAPPDNVLFVCKLNPVTT